MSRQPEVVDKSIHVGDNHDQEDDAARRRRDQTLAAMVRFWATKSANVRAFKDDQRRGRKRRRRR